MAKRALSDQYGSVGRTKRELVEDESLLVVRTKSRRPLGRIALDKAALTLMGSFESVVRYEKTGVEVLRTRVSRGRLALRDKARKVLGKSIDVQFAGRVLTDHNSDRPVLYIENLFVKFEDDVSPCTAKKVIKEAGLTIKREVDYARGAYFVDTEADTGRKISAIANKLLKNKLVQLGHLELVRPSARRAAVPQQGT
jgi:hypothetical protein